MSLVESKIPGLSHFGQICPKWHCTMLSGPQIAKKPTHLSPWVFWHDSSPPLAQGGKKNGPVFGSQLILTRFWRSCSPKHCKKSLILDLKFPRWWDQFRQHLFEKLASMALGPQLAECVFGTSKLAAVGMQIFTKKA